MAYLFDTDAISEVLRAHPNQKYLKWLQAVPREEQFTSAVAIGELYEGAFRSQRPEHHLKNIGRRILPAVTTLPYDVATARVFGELAARLKEAGLTLADADLQIAATALYHGLELVTGNVRHFARIPSLKINRALVEARGHR